MRALTSVYVNLKERQPMAALTMTKLYCTIHHAPKVLLPDIVGWTTKAPHMMTKTKEEATQDNPKQEIQNTR